MASSQTPNKDLKTTGSQGVKKSEFEEILKNPEFVKMMEEQAKEQAQKAIEEERQLSKLNIGFSFVTLKGIYVNKGRDRTTKDGKPIFNQATGETQRWPDKFNLTFANLSISRQIEVEQELFEQYKNRVDEDFILIYELIQVTEYSNLNLSLKIKRIFTPEEFKISEFYKILELKSLLQLSEQELEQPNQEENQEELEQPA